MFPPGASNVDYEGEMVVVIGKRAQSVPVDDALDYVFGVTTGNDVRARAIGYETTCNGSEGRGRKRSARSAQRSCTA